ncbi:12436_t:CDS:2 [Entrophospora sp. SA101]|nr:12436_t:CDS:2 [Entrophospora sp. SA101]
MDHGINHYVISHFLQPDPKNQPEQSSDNISFLSIECPDLDSEWPDSDSEWSDKENE